MKKIEAKRLAKKAFADGGIHINQKDMKDVIIHNMMVEDYFPHRRIFRVEMNDGRSYEMLQETVDKDNNFSMGSAKYITREVREV